MLPQVDDRRNTEKNTRCSLITDTLDKYWYHSGESKKLSNGFMRRLIKPFIYRQYQKQDSIAPNVVYLTPSF